MPTEEIIKSLNWIDILVGVIILRVLYIGVKRGFVIEVFKLIGVLFAVFITLHYFSVASRFLQDSIHLPEGMGNLAAYAFLWAVASVVFKLIRDGFLILFKIEAHSGFDRWGGLLLAIGRGLLLCSLTLLFLNIAGVGYLSKALEKSFTASRLVPLSPKFYEATYEGFVSKFFPSEKLNTAAFTLSDFQSKEKQEKK